MPVPLRQLRAVAAVTACASVSVAARVLVPRADPGLSLTVKDGTYESLCLMLRSAEVDFIVGPLRQQAVASDLAEETLFVDRFVAVARQGHLLLRRRGKATVRQVSAGTAHPYL